jgi:hypothetical protein
MRDHKRALEKAQAGHREADVVAITAELRDIDRQIETLFTTVETRLQLDPEQTAPVTLARLQNDIAAARLSAVLSVVSDDQGGFVLLIPAEGPVRAVPLPGTHHRDFDDLVGDWLKTYARCFSRIGAEGHLPAQAAQDWEAHLQTSLPDLWDRAGATLAGTLAGAGLGPDRPVALRDALATQPGDHGAPLQTSRIVLPGEADEAPGSPQPDAPPAPNHYPLSTSAAFFTFGR